MIYNVTRSERNVCAFWRRVELIIAGMLRTICGENNVFDCKLMKVILQVS